MQSFEIVYRDNVWLARDNRPIKNSINPQVHNWSLTIRNTALKVAPHYTTQLATTARNTNVPRGHLRRQVVAQLHHVPIRFCRWKRKFSTSNQLPGLHPQPARVK